MDYCHFNMEKCYFLFILSIFCSYLVNYSSFLHVFFYFLHIFSYFSLFMSIFWHSFIFLQQNQHFYISVFVCFYQLSTCINVIFRKIHFPSPNIIPCVPSFSHVHAKFHVFLYSPINRADTYLRSLSLHTIKNCAKISCIGLFPYGPFFISI